MNEGAKLKKGKEKAFIPYYLKDSSFSRWMEEKESQSDYSFKREYLPTSLSTKERNSLIELNQPGNRIKYIDKENNEAVVIRADNSIPVKCGIFYFEIELLNFDEQSLVALGLCSFDSRISKLPGIETYSYGFHLNETTIYHSSINKHPYGQKCLEKDFIGCGINFYENLIFFTRNGINLGVAFRDFRKEMVPCIGLKGTGVQLDLNFGQKQFKYDIHLYYKGVKSQLWEKIRQTPIDIAFKDKDDDHNNSTISLLITSYLIHHGYISTAYKFAQNSMGINAKDDKGQIEAKNIRDLILLELNKSKEDDIKKRKVIRGYILDGAIDECIAYIEKHYPKVFRNNDMILFQLKCQKFIEILRELGGLENDVPPSNNRTNKVQNHEEIIERAVLFGKQLHSEYSSSENVEIKTTLMEILCLLAYNDLSKSTMYHLLDISNREQLANTLNSAILVSQGRPPIPHLELIYRQTGATNNFLIENDICEGGLIDVKGDCLL